MKPIALCIVGCGAVVADLHMPVVEVLSRKRAVTVVALVDNQKERAGRFLKKFPRATVYEKLDEALRAQPIGLTFIASPPGLHAEHALTALASGSHVLVEKPMVTRSSDAQRLAEATKAAGRVTAVGLPRRYYPHIAEVADLIARGLFGSNLTFRYREGGAFGWPVASDAVFKREKSGGGVLMDKGVHALDVLEQLFGDVRVVRCRDDALHGGVECGAVLDLQYPNVKGELSLSWDQPLNNGIWISGSSAEAFLGLDVIHTYKWRQPGGKWTVRAAQKAWPKSLLANGPLKTPTDYYQCIALQWWGALRAIVHGERPAVDAERAGQVIRAIETAYAQSEPLTLPWLTPLEQSNMNPAHWRAAA